MSAQPPTALDDLLSEAQLTKLREDFDYSYACADILYALASAYEPVPPNIKRIVRTFYTAKAQQQPGGLAPDQRELVQLALAIQHGNRLNIGIHVYWALCQDDALTVAQVINASLLSTTYLGVDNWANAQAALRGALTAMGASADSGKTQDADVFGSLVAALA